MCAIIINVQYYTYVPSSYDVVFTAGADAILKKFKDFNCRVVFSAEGFCWPDQTLAVSKLVVIRNQITNVVLRTYLYRQSIQKWDLARDF